MILLWIKRLHPVNENILQQMKNRKQTPTILQWKIHHLRLFTKYVSILHIVRERDQLMKRSKERATKIHNGWKLAMS